LQIPDHDEEVDMKCSLALVLVLGIAACGSDSGRNPDAASGAPAVDSQTVMVSPLLNPSRANETAPDLFRARFETTEGAFVVEVHRAWSPRGADRFYNLVKVGYYDSVYVHRVIPGLAQFGYHPDPRINLLWYERLVGDDPLVESNTRGRISFAHRGLNTRTVQLFINRADNSHIDVEGFVPFGEVVEGMEIIDAFYADYGEVAPRGPGPDPGQAGYLGNAYFRESFPELSQVLRASIADAPG
jgi:peptidyl-prolyl cis-trans isomerase A (cyclophilin A)